MTSFQNLAGSGAHDRGLNETTMQKSSEAAKILVFRVKEKFPPLPYAGTVVSLAKASRDSLRLQLK